MKKQYKKYLGTCDCWDWAYACCKNKGRCEQCPYCKDNKCIFANKEGNEFEIITTKKSFDDCEQEYLIKYFNKIIEEKTK